MRAIALACSGLGAGDPQAPRGAAVNFDSNLISRARKAFREKADADHAIAMKAYMRDQFEFYGIMRKERDSIRRAALVGLAKPTEAELVALARTCWSEPERE